MRKITVEIWRYHSLVDTIEVGSLKEAITFHNLTDNAALYLSIDGKEVSWDEAERMAD